jgi:hypothetical protein
VKYLPYLSPITYHLSPTIPTITYYTIPITYHTYYIPTIPTIPYLSSRGNSKLVTPSLVAITLMCVLLKVVAPLPPFSNATLPMQQRVEGEHTQSQAWVVFYVGL